MARNRQCFDFRTLERALDKTEIDLSLQNLVALNWRGQIDQFKLHFRICATKFPCNVGNERMAGNGRVADPQRTPPYDQFVFNIRASYREETRALVDYLYHQGYRRIGFLGQADASGTTVEIGVNAALEEYGLKIVSSAASGTRVQAFDAFLGAVAAPQITPPPTPPDPLYALLDLQLANTGYRYHRLLYPQNVTSGGAVGSLSGQMNVQLLGANSLADLYSNPPYTRTFFGRSTVVPAFSKFADRAPFIRPSQLR